MKYGKIGNRASEVAGTAAGILASSVLGISCAYALAFAFFATVCAFRTEGVDDCVLRYARQLNAGTATGGYVYVNPDGSRHIDADFYDADVRSVAKGCMQSSLVDATYCEVARQTEPIHYFFTKK